MTNVLDIDEACAFLKVPKSTLYKLARRGKIPAFKMGKEWRFDKALVNEWIRRQIELNSMTGEQKSQQ